MKFMTHFLRPFERKDMARYTISNYLRILWRCAVALIPLTLRAVLKETPWIAREATKRTFQNIEIKWSIAGHLMNYLRTKLNLQTSIRENLFKNIYSYLREILLKNVYLSSYISTTGELNKYMIFIAS